MTNNQNFEPTQSETELGSVEEARIETELDLLTDQARVLATHMLSEEKSNLDNHQFQFVQFLRLIKSPEQRLALTNLYTDLELILHMQESIDFLDEHDPLGQPTLENSAKKTIFLLETVSRIISNILLIKPEAHYLKETYKLRKGGVISVDEYQSIKSPELDLVKAFTNLDQLKLLLINSVQNRQANDLLDSLHDRLIPHFKEYIKGLRRYEAKALEEELLGSKNDLIVEEDNTNREIEARNQAEELLRQTVLSLTESFLTLQSHQNGLSETMNEMIASLKEVYRAITEFRRTSAAHVVEDKAKLLTKLIEQSILYVNRSGSLPINKTEAKQYSFLLELMEYVTQLCSAIDNFFEHHPSARIDEGYQKRLDFVKDNIRHLRSVIRQEHYQQDIQLPFLNLKSFIYFAVKVIKDLNYFNPQIKRKYRYYIERNILDQRLQEAFKQIPVENRLERRYTIPILLELNRMIRIVSNISPKRDDRSAYQLTYYWFRLIEDNITKMVNFLKTYPVDDKLASRFDSIAFTLEMEAERVFGKNGHLAHLNEQSPLEEYIKRVEDSIGILGRVLQENYVYIAQAYLPKLTRIEIDSDYKERLNDALLVREHTWCVWTFCSNAEQQLKTHLEKGNSIELTTFLTGLIRPIQAYLLKFLPKVFYSDRVELKRTFNDLLSCATLLVERRNSVTKQHLQQLAERLHLFTTLLASLAENIRNRSVLESHPFDEETAKRTLQKYIQLGTV